MRFKYPKFTTLIFLFLVAYIFGNLQHFKPAHEAIRSLGLLGFYLAGIMYSNGFTAPIGTSVLLILSKGAGIFSGALVAGIGAVMGDLLIFLIVRFSFADEIKKLGNEPLVHWVADRSPPFLKKYGLPLIALTIIASPLPDEIGVTILAVETIPPVAFAALSFFLNSCGIAIILAVGQAV